MSASVAPHPQLQTTSPPPRLLGASAGTQQVPFQFAAHSGVPYSHGKNSLSWGCEPPNPETRRDGQILPAAVLLVSRALRWLRGPVLLCWRRV